MIFKDFMNYYDNWNGTTRINDDNLECIVEGRTNIIMDTRPDLLEREVVAFGFYDGELVVRVK